MRVRRVANVISDELAEQMGGRFSPWRLSDLVEGKEYVVFGLQFAVGSPNYGTRPQMTSTSSTRRLSGLWLSVTTEKCECFTWGETPQTMG